MNFIAILILAIVFFTTAFIGVARLWRDIRAALRDIDVMGENDGEGLA